MRAGGLARSLLLAGSSLLGGSPLAAQPAPTPAPAATPRPSAFQPLLPSEGLLRGETWLALAERLLARLVDWVPLLAAALLVLGFFLIASRLAARLLQRTLPHTRTDAALQELLLPLVRVSILAIGVIMALSQAGFQVGSLLAGVGVVGLAVGLAAQDTLGNMVAGFSILWDRPFRLGDRVTINDVYGQVMHIGLRSTRLRTLDQLDVILPNKDVVNRMIVNHTLTPTLRLAVPVAVAYRVDTRRAREVLLAAVEGHPRVLPEPAPEVVVTALDDWAVRLELRVWLRDPHTERATLCALTESAKIALQEAGVELPFPQHTIHFDPESPPLRVSRHRGAGGNETGGEAPTDSG
jgi:small conductance mechanosensitive channel